MVLYDHFVTGLDDPNELELLVLPCAWPAPVEVARAIQTDIERAGKREVVGEGRFDQAAITGREGMVYVAYGFVLGSARGPPWHFSH